MVGWCFTAIGVNQPFDFRWMSTQPRVRHGHVLHVVLDFLFHGSAQPEGVLLRRKILSIEYEFGPVRERRRIFPCLYLSGMELARNG